MTLRACRAPRLLPSAARLLDRRLARLASALRPALEVCCPLHCGGIASHASHADTQILGNAQNSFSADRTSRVDGDQCIDCPSGAIMHNGSGTCYCDMQAGYVYQQDGTCRCGAAPLSWPFTGINVCTAAPLACAASRLATLRVASLVLRVVVLTSPASSSVSRSLRRRLRMRTTPLTLSVVDIASPGSRGLYGCILPVVLLDLHLTREIESRHPAHHGTMLKAHYAAIGHASPADEVMPPHRYVPGDEGAPLHVLATLPSSMPWRLVCRLSFALSKLPITDESSMSTTRARMHEMRSRGRGTGPPRSASCALRSFSAVSVLQETRRADGRTACTSQQWEPPFCCD